MTATNKECSKLSCDQLSTHILLGRDQEFLGFFCLKHGLETQEGLESKLHFEKENKVVIVKKRKKSVFKIKRKNRKR